MPNPNLDLSFAVNKEVDYQIDAVLTEGTATFPADSVTLTSPDPSVCAVQAIDAKTVTITPQAGVSAGTQITLTGTANVTLPAGATPFPFTVTVTFSPQETPPPVDSLGLTGTVVAERFLP